VPVFTETERARFGALPPIPFDEEGDWAREEWRRSWRWRGPGQTRADVLRTYAEKMRPGARERGATAIAAYDMAGALRAVRQPLLIVRPEGRSVGRDRARARPAPRRDLCRAARAGPRPLVGGAGAHGVAGRGFPPLITLALLLAAAGPIALDDGWQEATVSVADLDARIAFFREVAGWELVGRGTVGRAQLDAWRIPAGTTAETALLRQPGVARGTVRLVAFSGAEGGRASDPRRVPGRAAAGPA
jgi:hypothetical protein